MDIAQYILGACLLSVPGDPELSIELCRMQWEAQNRAIIPDNPLPDTPWLYNEVRGVVWPKPEVRE